MQIPEIAIADYFLACQFLLLYFFVPDKEMHKTLSETTF